MDSGQNLEERSLETDGPSRRSPRRAWQAWNRVTEVARELRVKEGTLTPLKRNLLKRLNRNIAPDVVRGKDAQYADAFLPNFMADMRVSRNRRERGLSPEWTRTQNFFSPRPSHKSAEQRVTTFITQGSEVMDRAFERDETVQWTARNLIHRLLRNASIDLSDERRTQLDYLMRDMRVARKSYEGKVRAGRVRRKNERTK